MTGPRWLARLHAFVGGYFWLPCRHCGRMFGGQEITGDCFVYVPGANGYAVCSPSCASAEQARIGGR